MLGRCLFIRGSISYAYSVHTMRYIPCIRLNFSLPSISLFVQFQAIHASSDIIPRTNIYIYICFKNVKMKQVCKGMVRFRRATNRLVFRQEFEARFIGRDIKVLATVVYIYILDSSKYDYFKIRILIYSASRCDFLIREYFVLNCGRNYYSILS